MPTAEFSHDFVRPSADGPQTLSATGSAMPLPHVVAWNMTRRCNLECAHCYISAGPWADTRADITGEEFRRITDEILELTPAPMFILTGGEPLLRDDLEELAAFAVGRGATVVVGTNGTGLTEDRIRSLKDAGVTGVAVSIDSLDARYHNRFRHGDQALEETTAAVDRLSDAKLDFIVQTTVTRANKHEVRELVAWSEAKGAVSFNLYFLVETGRGRKMQSLSPAENEEVLLELVDLQKEYRGRLMIRSKCQPQLMRYIHEQDPDSPLMNYSTRCPCGTQYCRITPDAKLTPCPYLPTVAGDLRKQSFGAIWKSAPLLQEIRSGGLGGKCGDCRYRQVCGGCRARAYARTGELLAADDSCAYEPKGLEPPVARGERVTYGSVQSATMPWSVEAEARIRRVPSFVRGVVIKRTEDRARSLGTEVITIEFLDQVRRDMPVDFSKRLPGFLRRDDD